MKQKFDFLSIHKPEERIKVGKIVFKVMRTGLLMRGLTLRKLKKWIKDDGVQKAYERINKMMNAGNIPYDIRESQRMMLEYIETLIT